MKKIKITIEIPDDETIVIETNHILAVIAELGDGGEKTTPTIHVTTESTYATAAMLGYSACNATLQVLKDEPEISAEFIEAIEKLLHKED